METNDLEQLLDLLFADEEALAVLHALVSRREMGMATCETERRFSEASHNTVCSLVDLGAAEWNTLHTLVVTDTGRQAYWQLIDQGLDL